MKNKNQALNDLVDTLRDKYFSKEDQVLLTLVCSENPSQESLDECLAVYDIEAAGGLKSLLLSYLLHDNPHLQPSEYAGPRLKGLIKFWRFRNLKTLSHFSKIGRALNEANIPLLLFKGGAMKFLRPALSRAMGDVDILVPKERFAEAVRIGEDLGYMHTHDDSRHGVDFHTETESAVDVHHSIFDYSGKAKQFHKGIFQRAKPCHGFGVEFLLPCHEDLYFLVLTNLTKNLREHTSLKGLQSAFCDCHFLPKNKADFDWRIVWENAVLSETTHEARFAVEFMNALVPGLIPDMDQNFPVSAKDMDVFCNQIVFDANFLRKRQEACQKIRVVQLKNHPWQFGKQIATYLVMKRLRHNPAFVRWYLNSSNTKGAPLAN